MFEVNRAFLEAYKSLDTLCRDMYGGGQGVTAYIDDMRNTSEFEKRNIPNWDADFNELKSFRCIRNQLAHDVGTLSLEVCTPEMVNWLIAFRNRILNQTDPLALLRKKRQQTYPRAVHTLPTQTNYSQPREDKYDYYLPKSSKGCLCLLVGAVCLLVLAYMLLC